MKNIQYLIAGILFGIIMSKSEAFSWYRIQEMFYFQSFHMYGIIGVAVCLGAGIVYLIKKYKLKDFSGHPIIIPDKKKSVWSYLLGGIIFGLGWALAGACPGPMFVTLGNGLLSMALVIFGAFAGTWVYGLVRTRLPH